MNIEEVSHCDGDHIDGLKFPEIRKRKRSLVSVMKDVIKQERKDEKRAHRKESSASNGGRSIRDMIMSIFHNASPPSTSSEELSTGELRASRSLPTIFDGDGHASSCHCSQTPDSAITGSSVLDQNKLQAPSPDHRIHKGSWPISRVDYAQSIVKKTDQNDEKNHSVESLTKTTSPICNNNSSDGNKISPIHSIPTIDSSNTIMEKFEIGSGEEDNTIRSSVDQELRKILRGKRYHPELAKIWCRKISDRVTKNIQELTNYRKKVVTAVYIGQVQGDRVDVAVKCQRDTSSDNFVTVYTTGEHLYAWVSVVAFDMPDTIIS